MKVARSAVLILVAASVLALSSCAGGAKTVDMKDFKYLPEEITITEGTKVTWKNIDVEAHTVTTNGWDSGVIEAGKTYSRTFDVAGTYDYRCVFHPTMLGRLIVTAKTSRY